MAGKSYAEIVGSDEVQAMVSGYVDELNTRLNRWETIKKWELLDHDLTVESGELTPSMKVKRNVVEGNNKDTDRRVLRLTPCVHRGRTGSVASMGAGGRTRRHPSAISAEEHA